MLAIYLELLFPGAGFVYAGESTKGAISSLITIIGVFIGFKLWLGAIGDGFASFNIYTGWDFSEAHSIYIWVSVLYLIWASLRAFVLFRILSAQKATIAKLNPIPALQV